MCVPQLVAIVFLATLQADGPEDSEAFTYAGRALLPTLPSPVYVVAARVVETTPQLNGMLATMTIEKVYVGPDQLSREQFRATSYDVPPQGSGATRIVPALQVRERGVWILQRKGESLTPITRPYLGVTWPARETMGFEYDQALHFGAAIKRASEANDEVSRVTLLRRYAQSKAALTSAWAIGGLAEYAKSDGDAASFLNDLVDDESLVIDGQIALDEALLVFDRTRWQHSQRRLDFLRRWVEPALDEREGDRVRTHLDLLAQHPQASGIEQAPLLRLVRTFVFNDAVPDKIRSDASSVVYWSAKRYQRDEDPFAFIVEALQAQLPREVKFAMARTLLHAFQLDEQRRLKIQKILAENDDDRVVSVLKKALRLSQE